MEEQRLKQEDRVRKAMERARAEPKKQVRFLTNKIHLNINNMMTV